MERGDLEPKREFFLVPGCTVSGVSVDLRDGKKSATGSSPAGDHNESRTNSTRSNVVGAEGKDSKSTTKRNKNFYVFKISWPGVKGPVQEHDSESEPGGVQQIATNSSFQSPSTQKSADGVRSVSHGTTQSLRNLNTKLLSPSTNMRASPTNSLQLHAIDGSGSVGGAVRRNSNIGQSYSEDLDEHFNSTLPRTTALKYRHSSATSLPSTKILHRRTPSRDRVVPKSPMLQRHHTSSGPIVSPTRSLNAHQIMTIPKPSHTATFNQAESAALTANAIEQYKKEQSKRFKKRIAQGSGLVAAVGAAAAATLLTAGIGLAAGLTFVGITAAAGGSGAVASRTYIKTKKSLETTLVLAASTAEEASRWRGAIISAIESYHAGYYNNDVMEEMSTDESTIILETKEQEATSTWANLFALDGHNPASALIPSSVLRAAGAYENRTSFSLGDDSSIASLVEVGHDGRGLGVYEQPGASWRPVEGGWMAFLGIGNAGLRIFEEDLSDTPVTRKGRQSFSNILSVEGMVELLFVCSHLCFNISTLVSALCLSGRSCPLLKAQAILDSSPINAFMCLMSYNRIGRHGGPGNWDSIAPLSCQRSSFRIIEQIDDHTDVIHLVFRPLYLFPSWTAPRDFCIMRYWRLDDDGCYVLCYDSVKHRECPPSPSYVRGDMHGVYTLAPLKKVHVSRHAVRTEEVSQCMLTHMVQTDPKGWVPTWKLSLMGNQGYADAFAVSSLMQLMDVRDALNSDRFVSAVSTGDDHPYRPQKDKALLRTISDSVHNMPFTRDDEDHQLSLSRSESSIFDEGNDAVNYDFSFCNKEVRSPRLSDDVAQPMTDRNMGKNQSLDGSMPALPESFNRMMWAEPDANSFMVRGQSYLRDKKKVNAGKSIFRLDAIDFLETHEAIKGMCSHPKERVQIALKREQMGGPKAPAFVFVMNILLPGTPNHQLMAYFALDDISEIDGTSGTPWSILANKFFFGESDEFRDNTFKLIPAVVEGNFMVRKAVGATPAIMGTKLKQYYTKDKRFFEIFLDVASSSVAAGVVRVVKGYVSTQDAFMKKNELIN